MASYSVGNPLKAAQQFVGQLAERAQNIKPPAFLSAGRPEEIMQVTAFVEKGIESFDSATLPQFAAQVAALAEEGALHTNKKGPNRAKLSDARNLYQDVAERAYALQTQDVAPEAAYYVKLLLVRDLLQATELEKNVFENTVPDQRREHLLRLGTLAVGGLAAGVVLGLGTEAAVDSLAKHHSDIGKPIADFLHSIGFGESGISVTATPQTAGGLSTQTQTFLGIDPNYIGLAQAGLLAGSVAGFVPALNNLVQTAPYEMALNHSPRSASLDTALTSSIENEAVRQQALEIYANALVNKAVQETAATGAEVIR